MRRHLLTAAFAMTLLRVVVACDAGARIQTAADDDQGDADATTVAPSITAQPQSVSVVAGQTATFAVTASGTAPLAYQWSKNGTPVSGAASSSYTTPATASGDNNAQFAVVISNAAGSVTSATATLTVTATAVPPTIVTQPTNANVIVGQPASFSVSATGTAPLTYQWRRNGADIPGATQSTYTIPATTLGDNNATFTVVVSGATGSITSQGATLTVSAAVAPTITVEPADVSVVVGKIAGFSVTATGTTPLAYQWKRDGADIAGATSSSYTIASPTLADSGKTFSVVVSNAAGSDTSRGATLTVTEAGQDTVTPWVTNNLTGIVMPNLSTTPDVSITIPAKSRKVSPYAFGVNHTSPLPTWSPAYKNEKLFRFYRIGGNSFSSYNWLHGYTNAGSDGGYNEVWEGCGVFFGTSDPGSMEPWGAESCTNGSAIRDALLVAVGPVPKSVLMMTFPLAGYIAGPTETDAILLNNGAPGFTLNKTYQTDFVDYISDLYAGASPPQYGSQFQWWQLDNEFDGWPSTHDLYAAALAKPTYTDVVGKMLAGAKYIKSKPNGWKVMGPATMTYDGMITGGANIYPTTDDVGYAAHGEFTSYFLSQFRAASETEGKTLLDAFDFHWYPEAAGGGSSRDYPEIRNCGLAATNQTQIGYVLNEPRNLWDPTYDDGGWGNEVLGMNKQYIVRLRQDIDAHFPGVAIGITEWNLGFVDNAVGLVAHADALGLFAREGVSYATYWQLCDDDRAVQSAFALYLSYDGAGGEFGDLYLTGSSTDADIAVHPSWDSIAGRLKVVLLNRAATAKTIRLATQSFVALTKAEIYTTAATTPFRPAAGTVLDINQGVVTLTLPARSGTMVVGKP